MPKYRALRLFLKMEKIKSLTKLTVVAFLGFFQHG